MSKKTLIRLIGAATCVAVMTAGWDAEAGWWRRHGSSGGSWGSCGSSGGSWGSSGSSGGSWGSHGSSGSWGSHGSSGGSHGSHGSSGGSYGSHGSSGGGHVIYHHHHPVEHHHPVVHHDEVVHHEPVVREKIVSEVVRAEPADTAKIVVDLPKDAKVFINGEETTATGPSRKFISTGLADGVNYRYDVRIVTADKDAPMEQTKTVTLARGQTETVRFDAGTATAVKPAAPTRDAVAAANSQ